MPRNLKSAQSFANLSFGTSLSEFYQLLQVFIEWMRVCPVRIWGHIGIFEVVIDRIKFVCTSKEATQWSSAHRIEFDSRYVLVVKMMFLKRLEELKATLELQKVELRKQLFIET